MAGDKIEKLVNILIEAKGAEEAEPKISLFLEGGRPRPRPSLTL